MQGEQSVSVDNAGRLQSLDLAVIVPTFNEGANVQIMVDKLLAALDGFRFEIIFVDDNSPDDTAGLVRAIGVADTRIRCVQRVGRRGLSSAVIEGMMATAAPVRRLAAGW